MKEESISGKLDKLIDITLEKRKSDRKLKLPFGVRMAQKRMAKKNQLLVFYCRRNNTIWPKTAQLTDHGLLELDNKVYDGGKPYIFLYQGKIPAAIVFDWKMTPITIKDFEDKTTDNDAQNIILKAIEAKEFTTGSKFGGKALIWIGIIVIAALYLLFGGTGGTP